MSLSSEVTLEKMTAGVGETAGTSVLEIGTLVATSTTGGNKCKSSFQRQTTQQQHHHLRHHHQSSRHSSCSSSSSRESGSSSCSSSSSSSSSCSSFSSSSLSLSAITRRFISCFHRKAKNSNARMSDTCDRNNDHDGKRGSLTIHSNPIKKKRNRRHLGPSDDGGSPSSTTKLQKILLMNPLKESNKGHRVTNSESSKLNVSHRSASTIEEERGKLLKRGGVTSLPITVLTHPLDRSISSAFVITLFFTLLALVSGVPVVLILCLLLPIGIALKVIGSCYCFSTASLCPLLPSLSAASVSSSGPSSPLILQQQSLATAPYTRHASRSRRHIGNHHQDSISSGGIASSSVKETHRGVTFQMISSQPQPASRHHHKQSGMVSSTPKTTSSQHHQQQEQTSSSRSSNNGSKNHGRHERSQQQEDQSHHYSSSSSSHHRHRRYDNNRHQSRQTSGHNSSHRHYNQSHHHNQHRSRLYPRSNYPLIPVTPLESFWLKDDVTNNNKYGVCNCLLFFDKTLSLEQLKDILVSRVLCKDEFWKFSARLVYKGLSRGAFWQKISLNDKLLNSLIFPDSSSKESITSRDDLKCRVLSISNSRLPSKTPLWQIRWLFLSYCNQVCLVLRVHQSVCDGVGLMSLLVSQLADQAPPSTTTFIRTCHGTMTATSSMFKPRFGGINFSLNVCRAVVVGPLTFFLWIWWAFTRRKDNFLKSFSSSHMTQQLRAVVSNLQKRLQRQHETIQVKQSSPQVNHHHEGDQVSSTCVSINVLPVTSRPKGVTSTTTSSSQEEKTRVTSTTEKDHLKHQQTSCTSSESREEDASSRDTYTLHSHQHQPREQRKEQHQSLQQESKQEVTSSPGIQSEQLQMNSQQEESEEIKENKKSMEDSKRGIPFKRILLLPGKHGHHHHHHHKNKKSRNHRSKKQWREEVSNYSNSSNSSKRNSIPIFEPLRSIYWTSLDLPKVYRIKQITRSCLNDVILAAVSGAIREYMVTKVGIVNPPDLTISIPVDIRGLNDTDSGTDPIPGYPVPSACSSNSGILSPEGPGVSFVLLTSPLPTNTEGSIPRLWEIRHLMEELKASADPAVMYGAQYFLHNLLPTSLGRLFVNTIHRNSSLLVSNLQGPSMKITIGTHRLHKMFYFMSPPSNIPITVNILSYHSKILLSVSTTSLLVPSAKALCKLIHRHIDLMSDLLSRRRVPGEARAKKRPHHVIIEAPVGSGRAYSPVMDDYSSGMISSTASPVSSVERSTPYMTMATTTSLSPSSSSLLMTTTTAAAVGTVAGATAAAASAYPVSWSTADLTDRLHAVQMELNHLNEILEVEQHDIRTRDSLLLHLEDLKTEFSELMKHLRRRKSIADYGPNIVINLEEEDDFDDDMDGDLRPPPRRFSLTGAAATRRSSVVSSAISFAGGGGGGGRRLSITPSSFATTTPANTSSRSRPSSSPEASSPERGEGKPTGLLTFSAVMTGGSRSLLRSSSSAAAASSSARSSTASSSNAPSPAILYPKEESLV